MTEPAGVWDDRDTSNCSIARTLSVVGERWTFLILRELWYGSSRFSEIERVLGCPRNLLATRLRMLVEQGIVETVDYREPGARTRHRYVVTAKGADLVPAVLAMMAWGDRYYADPEGPPVVVTHRDCGADLHVDLRCTAGHRVATSELHAIPGPGYRTTSGT
jgi:DNA-binding HxlR family transcriptional regulator